MSRFKTALSLYVALAVHLLLILLLAFGISSGQSMKGSGSGFGGDDAVAPAVSADAASDPVEARQRDPAKKAASLSDSLMLAATPIELQPKPRPAPPRSVKAEPAKVAKKAIAAKPAGAPVAAVAGSGAAGGGSGGYIAEVRAQLSRNRRSLPGVLTTAHSEVAFNIGVDGRVSDVQLAQSSGIAELDREATAMVLRASPFAPPPDGRVRRLSVPVSVEPPRL